MLKRGTHHQFGNISQNNSRYIWGQTGRPQKKVIGGLVRKTARWLFGWVPKKVQRIMKIVGEEKPITQIWVVRSPVQKYVDYLLNAISLGKFFEAKSKYGYDTFYHLSITFNINNVFYRLEKNDLVNLELYKPRPDEEKIFCSEGVNLSLNEVFEKTIQRIGNDHFWSYSAFKFNCQDFIKQILTTMGVYSDAINDFVYQDVSQLAQDLGGQTTGIAQELTDLAGGVSSIIQQFS